MSFLNKKNVYVLSYTGKIKAQIKENPIIILIARIYH